MNQSQNLTLKRNDEVDAVALVRILWSKKYVIILITALFAAISIYYALTATHIFRAQVVVTQVGEGGMNGTTSFAGQFGGLASLAGINMNTAGGGREAQAILKSRQLIEEFIERNGLLAELSPQGSEPLSLWQAVKHFQELILAIREDTDEGTTTVAISWTDPVVAANWANQFVDLANELIRTRALEEAAANISYLNKQIAQTNVVGLQNVMYNLIEAETKTVMLANARSEYAFAVVDPAVAPEIRSSPNRKLMVLSGTAFGLIFAVISVLIWNFIVLLKSDV